jgi:transcriptional regulator with XRE-family HTH domain
MQYDARYQDRKDGALTKDVRERLQKIREKGFTLKDIGDLLGFSGPFISQLLNERSPARLRSVHIPKIIQAIERAEAEIVPSVKQPNPLAQEEMSLEQLMRAIVAKGFEVTVKAK